MQDENKEGGKTSQLPVSGIGKGLTLVNMLKFGFRLFPLFVLIQKVEQKNQVRRMLRRRDGRHTSGKWSIGVFVLAWWMGGTNGQDSAA